VKLAASLVEEALVDLLTMVPENAGHEFFPAPSGCFLGPVVFQIFFRRVAEAGRRPMRS
jgi:hypothetical protein